MRIATMLCSVAVGLTASPSIVEYAIPTPNSAPHCLVAAPDGLIWFAEIGANKLGRFDPRTERFTEWSVPTADGRPHGIAWASDARLYVTEQRGNKIAAFDPKTERFTEYPLPHDGSGPHTPIQGPDGMIWFAELEGHKLGRVDVRTGKVTEFPTPTPNSGVRRLAIDRGGGIWMSYNRAGKVAPFAPGTQTFREYDAPGGPRGQPYTIEVDSTGHVWFSQFDPTANDLVELDPATGKMTRYKIPGGPALVRKLSVDAHNTVWYANNGQGKIGKVKR